MNLKINTKKGFTLVELIATIALIAIITIIAVPEIISLFEDTKINSFLDEAKIIYKSIETSYNSDFLEETIKVSRYCESKEGYIRRLRIDKSEDIFYDIEISDSGNVTKFYVANNKYQLLLDGEDIKIDDIIVNNVVDVEDNVLSCD